MSRSYTEQFAIFVVSSTNHSVCPKFVIFGNYLAVIIDALIPQKDQELYLPARKEGRRAFPKELQLFIPPMGKQGAGSVQGMAEDIIPNKGLKELWKSQTWHFNLSQLKEELVCLFLSLKKYRCFPGTSCLLGFAASIPATPRCHYRPCSWERTLPKPRARAKASAFSWPGSFWEIQPVLRVPFVWVGRNWSSETTCPSQALTGTAPATHVPPPHSPQTGQTSRICKFCLGHY